MQRLQFSILLKADRAKIWHALWDHASYSDWTSVFFPGSHAVTEAWEEGSIVMFLTPEKHGMYSRIVQHVPGERMWFSHIGGVKDGVQLPVTEADKAWSGSVENYSLEAAEEGHRLMVEVDTDAASVASMEKVFPRALERLRVLAEG